MSESLDQSELGLGDFLSSLQQVERLHRRILDIIKLELDRCGYDGLNSVQALLLYNIGNDELTVGRLSSRGYYQGSNVSYNLKKLVTSGFIIQQRSEHDARSQRLKLSDRGLHIHQIVVQLLSDHYQQFVAQDKGYADKLEVLSEMLIALEQFWVSKSAR